MLYIGNKINYIGDGFIKIESPFSKESKIKTVSGRVVFDDAWGVYLSSISGKTLFVKKDYGFDDDNRNIYDRDGVCILIRPSDDKWMAVTRDAICTGKDITQYGNEEHKIRIRVFNLSGEYMATRIYTGKISFGDYNWNQYSEGQEFLTEYIEEVVELEDGVKMFIQNDDYSQRSEEISMDDENIENVAKSSTPKIQPREQVRTGHWEYKECPTCYGYGEHNKVDCKYCLEAYRNGYNIKCLACGGSEQVPCPNHKIELKKYVYD